MSKILRLSLLLFLFSLCGGALFAQQTKSFNVSKGDPRVKIGNPPEGCGDKGTCFWVDLVAPGNITSVDYTCEGRTCGWVHPCPDGGRCNLHADQFEISGSTAKFWGWTNSGATEAV